jgi:hypothetical protein
MGLMRLMGPMRLMGLIGLMGLMGGCSSEQEPPVEPKPEVKETAIAFSGNMTEEKVTRAESTTPLNEKGVTSFRVWAFKNDGPQGNPYSTYQTVMPGYHVRYEASNSSVTNTDGWDYILPAYPDQTPKYWDMEAKAYRFFAATSGTTVTGKKENESDESFSSYQVSFTADAINEEMTPYYSKLWFSNNSNGEFGKPVTLQFMQLLSKVRFMIILADPTIPLLLEEDDFRPTNKELRIAKKANATITYPLKGNETTEQVDIDPSSNQSLSSLNRRWTEASTAPPVAEDHYWETVIPATNQGSYIYKVRVDGEEKSCIVPAQYMDWLPGYSYTYVFKVNGDGGVELESVRTSFADWQTGGDKEYILYNW